MVTDSLFIVSKKTERVKYIQKRYAPQGRLKLQVNIQDCTQSVENMLQKRGVMSLFKKDRHNTSLSFMGQYSAGNDSRIGGRLLFDYMTHFSKRGIAQYVLVGLDYNRYKKEPEGVWWNENGQVAQPALNDVNFSLGYGLGFNLLGRMEIMPYAMAGYQRTFLTGRESLIYWDSNSDDWATLDFTDSKTGKSTTDMMPLSHTQE